MARRTAGGGSQVNPTPEKIVIQLDRRSIEILDMLADRYATPRDIVIRLLLWQAELREQGRADPLQPLNQRP